MKSILIIDDSFINCEILLELLRDDFTLLTAVNGTEALEVLKKNKIDLILLDWFLPGISGPVLLTEINKLGSYVIAIITGDYAIKAEDLSTYNVKKVFYKPFDFKTISKDVLKLF